VAIRDALPLAAPDVIDCNHVAGSINPHSNFNRSGCEYTPKVGKGEQCWTWVPSNLSHAGCLLPGNDKLSMIVINRAGKD